eukprot:15366520-Ditylum_brightwellii.AAC.1
MSGPFFQFTTKHWQPPEANPIKDIKYNDLFAPEWDVWKEKVTLVKESTFPYIDMKISWLNLCLYFSAYCKKNPMIKCINKESCHYKAVFKANPEDHPKANDNSWVAPYKGTQMPGEAGASAGGERET